MYKDIPVYFLIILNDFINRSYSQDSTRPQTESYRAAINYRGGRVRSATQMILILNSKYQIYYL